MKKLLITVIGAAAALGASAALPNTYWFEEKERGTTDVATLGSSWSEAENSTNTYAIVELERGDGEALNKPASFEEYSDPTNALSVKTTFGKPLSFKVDSAAVDIDSGLYFDSLVKFTVCDAGQDTSLYDGAKIVMWLEQNEAETQTNLMVRAGYLSVGDSGVSGVATKYTCNKVGGDFADKWHRVTIKAIRNITADTTTSVPGFAIYIDGQIGVLSDDSKWDDTFTYELAEAVSNLGRAKLFPSIVQDLENTAMFTLETASFDGTGFVAELESTRTAPDFAQDYVAPKASVKIGDAAAENYGSLADAIGAANGAAEGAAVVITLAKGFDFDAPVTIKPTNTGVSVVLDFNGFVINNTGSECLITNSAALTVTDSSSGATGGIVGKAICQGDGSLTINGGNFWTLGAFDLSGATTVSIAGGSFKDDDTAFETGETESGTWIADGMTLQYNSETGLNDVVEKVNYAAQIGQQGYETFAAALAAAVDGDTITLLGNVTAPKFQIDVAKFGVQGLTINLGGYTYTFDGGSDDGIYLLSSNKLTIANGTLAAAEGTAYRDLVRDYNSVLTLNNVTINGANFPEKDGSKLACLLCIEGGDVNVLGSTSIINVKPAAYAIKMGNHAQAWYEMGTTTINTTGNIEGNILIAGGVYNEVAVGSGSTINYYYGKNVHSSWEDGVSSANFAARLGTLAETGAQDNVSGQLFKTLKDAVDAASAGDTVTVLADSTISTPLSIAKNLTVHNDYTITGAVNYAICIGATVSFEGSGKIERASNISGSAFCVGANETTRGAITVGTAGALTFDGLTVCGGSGGNLIKLENGTVTMNGGVLRDGKRGIKADADVGSYTSAIVINGGTITNNTDCAVMASAASTNGTATVVVNGGVIAGALVYDGKAGTYSITIPGTSTAKFNADQSEFCESGYETTLSDGWYVVTKVKPSVDPIDTTTGGSATFDDATAAANAAQTINDNKETFITVAKGVTGEAKNTYLSKVEAVANGKTVTIQFTSAAATEAQTQADADNASLPLANIAAAEVSADATITATPGFYYTVKSGTEPGSLTAGTPVLATGTTVTLPIPNKGAAGFYKIEVKPTK